MSRKLSKELIEKITAYSSLEGLEDKIKVNYGGSNSFTNTEQQGGVLTANKMKEMAERLGKTMKVNSPYLILTPDNIYALKNPPIERFEWREPKEMVMEDIVEEEEVKNTTSIEESQESMSMTAEARSRYEELDELEDHIQDLGFDDTKDVLRFLNSRKAQRQRKQEKTKQVKREDRQILI